MKIIPNTSNVEVLTPTGFQPFSALSVTEPEDGYCLRFTDKTTITVSTTHLFMRNGVPTLASQVLASDELDTMDGRKKVESVEKVHGRRFLGPLNVYGHLYSQSPTGLVHHNCQFIGSSTTLIGPDALDKLVYSEPVSYKYGYSLSIYAPPEPGAFYILGVDSAAGTGKDYSVIQVLRVHKRGQYEQVAKYADNCVSPGKFAQILKEVSEFYNDAQAIVENNEIGKTVADEAWYSLGYDRIINTDERGIGTRATKTSKLDACINLKKMLESGSLLLHDRQTIHEIAIFEEVAPNVFKAPRGKHDDHVSALYWACYGLIQPEVDLDNLAANKAVHEDIPQTFWGDSTDDVDINWF